MVIDHPRDNDGGELFMDFTTRNTGTAAVMAQTTASSTSTEQDRTVSLHWAWGAYAADGMVFGPLPPTNWSIALHVDTARTYGLESLQVATYEAADGDLLPSTPPSHHTHAHKSNTDTRMYMHIHMYMHTMQRRSPAVAVTVTVVYTVAHAHPLTDTVVHTVARSFESKRADYTHSSVLSSCHSTLQTYAEPWNVTTCFRVHLSHAICFLCFSESRFYFDSYQENGCGLRRGGGKNLLSRSCVYESKPRTILTHFVSAAPACDSTHNPYAFRICRPRMRPEFADTS